MGGSIVPVPNRGIGSDIEHRTECPSVVSNEKSPRKSRAENP